MRLTPTPSPIGNNPQGPSAMPSQAPHSHTPLAAAQQPAVPDRFTALLQVAEEATQRETPQVQRTLTQLRNLIERMNASGNYGAPIPLPDIQPNALALAAPDQKRLRHPRRKRQETDGLETPSRHKAFRAGLTTRVTDDELSESNPDKAQRTRAVRRVTSRISRAKAKQRKLSGQTPSHPTAPISAVAQRPSPEAAFIPSSAQQAPVGALPPGVDGFPTQAELEGLFKVLASAAQPTERQPHLAPAAETRQIQAEQAAPPTAAAAQHLTRRLYAGHPVAAERLNPFRAARLLTPGEREQTIKNVLRRYLTHDPS